MGNASGGLSDSPPAYVPFTQSQRLGEQGGWSGSVPPLLRNHRYPTILCAPLVTILGTLRVIVEAGKGVARDGFPIQQAA